MYIPMQDIYNYRSSGRYIYIPSIGLVKTMSIETAVTAAKAGTRSLKATIPQSIALYLELEAGDALQWKMDTKDGKRVASVRKVRAR